MKNIYSVTFAGHREIHSSPELEKKLDRIIRELLKSKDFVEFHIGDNGAFDILSLSVIRKTVTSYRGDNSAVNLVLPYKKADTELIEAQFDSVIIPDICTNAHPKKAISLRNRYMIDNSDLLICYVTHGFGGAAETLKYAEKSGIKIINLK